MRYRDLRGVLAASVAIYAVAVATPAMAQTKSFDVPAQSAATGIPALATQADVQILVSEEAVRGKTIRAIKGSMTVDQAIRRVAADAGLRIVSNDGRTYTLAAANGGNAATSAADDYRGNEIVVTAQKRVESVQDVPIAITALSQKNLEEQKIEGGPDILRAVPNMTFSKSNFTSYNVSIRGIGTKAVSATTDPGVAVSFNNVGMIANRFFEQEFFDLERVEVLRGPQGTLYGRNATGGVINLITAKPKLNRFEGSLKGEVGNYNSRRLVGMLNVPIVSDELGLRVAGAMTQRDGYDYNSNTQNRVNGRDLYSLRATLGFEKPWLRGNVVWERFREDDNRSRTGKQLCHRDDSPDAIGSTPTRQSPDDFDSPFAAALFAPLQEVRAGLFSTGCKAGSLYDDAAFGTPNGLALNYIGGITLATSLVGNNRNPDGSTFYFVDPLADPYGGQTQSRDLREISSIRDPRYRAGSDIISLNLDVDLTENLTLSSQTAFNWSNVYSFQDYNRFNTVPIFNDTSNILEYGMPSSYRGLAPGGIFCDPQIGCSNRLAVFDISSGKSKQFSQEIRLQSESSGPFNFSIGGNFTKYKVHDNYYVMSNILTMLAAVPIFNGSGNLENCNYEGAYLFIGNPVPTRNSVCPYIDLNPVESIDGDGHNYFRSSNPYKLNSWALFGEAYYNINDNVKITAGLRYTRDKKDFTVVPSQLLLAPNLGAGGFVNAGHPATGEIKQKWGEFTGRIGLDWKPNWSFTDDSLLYASFSRGYKAGGANPPSPGFATIQQFIDYGILPEEEIEFLKIFNFVPVLELTAVNYGKTFDPEFVNAFEIGTKNTLAGGRLTLNAGAFFYDYTNYQVSQIKDRTAVNENFDAKIWGAELSATFEPVDNLRFNANLGYLRTKIGKGEVSIDPVNRTAGNPNYVTAKPWVQLPSNCVVPVSVAENYLQTFDGIQSSWHLCEGLGGVLNGYFPSPLFDPQLGAPYDPANYPELNGGAGLNSDLSGNELPNAPRWTANIGAQYTIPFDGDWSATIRGDGYWQAKSWARVFNLNPYDRLRSWTNFNISLRVDGPDDLSIEAHVKNVFNSTPITDAFLNSDDSGLTTNVFTLDPRIIGFSIAKKF